MGQYRISRNIEASIIEYIKSELSGSWSGINVEKTFARVYDIDTPIICVRVGNTTHDDAEIGDNATIRTIQVLIDIFAENDGQRLDLKDYLVSILKGGLVYYSYEIENGTIKTKTSAGRIRVLNIDDTPVEFDVEKSRLDVHDRYRHLLTLQVGTGQIEA